MSREPRALTTLDAFHRAAASPRAVVYKHSPICSLSAVAAREMHRFMEDMPEVPVFQVDVIGDRSLSREIAEATGVRHESPQALLFASGTVVWSASHSGVTAAALAGAVRAAAALEGRREPQA